jgi:fibronectin type 3 domain-containing protein
MMGKRFSQPSLLVLVGLLLALMAGAIPSSWALTPGGNAEQAAPLQPVLVTASDCTYTDRVVITWSPVVEATEYEVGRATSPTGTKTTVCTRNPPVTSCNDTTAVANTVYYYSVRAHELFGGWSDFSHPDTGIRKGPLPVPRPVGVTASDGTHADHVYVYWIRPPGTNTYTVSRSVFPIGVFVILGSTTGYDYRDYTAQPDSYYNYGVKACDRCDQCSQTSELDLGYRGFIPPVPTGVQASNCTYSDRVRITWNSVEGATSYEVWRGRSGESPSKIETTTETAYDDTTAALSVLYYYGVKACNQVGCSDLSDPVPGARCEGANSAYLPLIVR